MRLGQAYCQHELTVGCADPTSPCVSEECYDIFDDKCAATDEEVEKVDHDIENIIRSKGTCESLRSVDNYLLDTIYTMASNVCENPSYYDTLGEMCSKMIDAYCEKIIELGCVALSHDACVELSWSLKQGTLGDGYYCINKEDDGAPSAVNIAVYKATMNEIKISNSCE